MAVLGVRGDVRSDRSPRKRAVLLVLRYYLGIMRRQWWISVPAVTLPALGNTFLFYLTPLLVAGLVKQLAGGGHSEFGTLLPYVLGFAGLMLAGEVLWRVGLHFLNRLDA